MSLCQQLLASKACDRLCIIDKFEDDSYHVSHILDEHGIAHDVKWFGVKMALFDISRYPIYKWVYGEDSGCAPNPWQMRLRRLLETSELHFLAFVWKCERDAAAAAAAAVAAAAAAVAAAAADVAAAAAAAEWQRLDAFLKRLEGDAYP